MFSGLSKTVASLATPLSAEVSQIAGKINLSAMNLDRMLSGLMNGIGNEQIRAEAQKLAFITVLQSAIEKASSSQRFYAETAINDLWTKLSAVREPDRPGGSPEIQSMMQSQKNMMEALTTIMKSTNTAVNAAARNIR